LGKKELSQGRDSVNPTGTRVWRRVRRIRTLFLRRNVSVFHCEPRRATSRTFHVKPKQMRSRKENLPSKLQYAIGACSYLASPSKCHMLRLIFSGHSSGRSGKQRRPPRVLVLHPSQRLLPPRTHSGGEAVSHVGDGRTVGDCSSSRSELNATGLVSD
jgi:hypothetical protein